MQLSKRNIQPKVYKKMSKNSEKMFRLMTVLLKNVYLPLPLSSLCKGAGSVRVSTVSFSFSFFFFQILKMLLSHFFLTSITRKNSLSGRFFFSLFFFFLLVFSDKAVLFFYLNNFPIHAYTHTHTHIYIYIWRVNKGL